MLTSRFEEALVFANRLHAAQTRKGTPIPYIAHLLAVTALVLSDGGDEDQAIAALLHDAVEDQGGLPTLQQICSRFGERVALIVDGCTDAYGSPKPPWRERKERYIDHLKNAPAEVLRVSLADKLHNARSILRDLRQNGEDTWKRFNGGKSGTLWYYHTLVQVFQRQFESPMVSELAQVVGEMESQAQNDQAEN